MEYKSFANVVDISARKGCTFLGRNTKADGSGDEWNFNTSAMPAYDVILYARWNIYDFLFYKIDGNRAALSGVIFNLYTCNHNHDEEICGTDGAACTHTHSYLATNDKDSCWNFYRTQTSAADGVVLFEDLPGGDYMLVESETKTGYLLPAGQWSIQIGSNGAVIITAHTGDALPPAFITETGDDGKTIFKLPNYRIPVQPSTGDLESNLFTLSGLFFLSCLKQIKGFVKKIKNASASKSGSIFL